MAAAAAAAAAAAQPATSHLATINLTHIILEIDPPLHQLASQGSLPSIESTYPGLQKGKSFHIQLKTV